MVTDPSDALNPEEEVPEAPEEKRTHPVEEDTAPIGSPPPGDPVGPTRKPQE